jgi:putative intracellular protease/amidase
MNKMHKILILLTNASESPNSHFKTGFDIRELALMLQEFRAHSIRHEQTPKSFMDSVVFASLHGGPAPISPSSAEIGSKEQSVKDFLADEQVISRIRNTEPLESLNSNDFMAILVPGGHGPLFDLAQSERVGKFLEKCYFSPGGETGQKCLICAVCHGVGCLIRMKNGQTGEPFVKGRRLTCTSMPEENTERWANEMPFMLEEKMREMGALLTFAAPHTSNVVVDERLITGQNTESCREVIQKMIQITESWKTNE